MVKQVLIEWSDGNQVRDNGDVIGVKGFVLKPILGKHGYHVVSLKVSGKFHPYRVHRLVAQAFIPNPENKPEVNHKNGDKTDNRVENLEWVTSQENQIHATTVLKKCIGESHGMSAITEEVANEICKLFVIGHQNKRISEMLDVPVSIVSSIRNGMAWKNVSKQYNFQRKSRSLSIATVEWVCQMLSDGYTSVEIRDMSTNDKLTLQVIKAIKGRRNYRFISDNYNF